MSDPRRNSGGGRAARLAAALAIAGLVVVLYFVINSFRSSSDTGQATPFDPTTTDRSELRRVAEAVSRVISAPPSQHVAAVETLESVRAESAGARDLKESCVNTYRGSLTAEALTAQLRALLTSPDGGVRTGAQLAPAEGVRALDLERRAREQIELVQQSRDRCMDLYTAAVRAMGLTPAQRARR